MRNPLRRRGRDARGGPGRAIPSSARAGNRGWADAAGSARRHFDRALAGKGLEVLLGGVGRLEAQLLSDFRAGWRVAVVFQAAFDEGENLGLAWRQL
mgnify:CR=1 FL=1